METKAVDLNDIYFMLLINSFVLSAISGKKL
jgi:hypothetical protein